MRDIISLDDLTVNNIGVMRKTIEVSLPTSYPDMWYDGAFESDQLVKLAYFSELPVGVIRAKSFHTAANEKNSSYHSIQKYSVTTEVPNAMYIEAFAVLESYRGLGIGKKLLSYLVEETKKRFVHEIVLHVWVEMKDSVAWYEKQGFTKVAEVKDYYKEQGLENPDAIIMSLAV